MEPPNALAMDKHISRPTIVVWRKYAVLCHVLYEVVYKRSIPLPRRSTDSIMLTFQAKRLLIKLFRLNEVTYSTVIKSHLVYSCME